MSAKHTVAVDADVQAILQRSTITATSLTLPAEQFARPLYDRLDKVLKAAGGKWNRAAKAHLFARDPREALGLAVETGGIRDERKALQQFFTPPDLARALAAKAAIRPGHLVLEPSAGAGALARAAADAGGTVTCVELDETLRAQLETEFELSVARDFLTLTPVPSFDRVLMNPPFEKGQDVAHVMHAIAFLKPGGRLVAVMPAGVTTNTTKTYRAFREAVARAGRFEPLPDEAFARAGTNVRTVVLTIQLPEAS